VVVNQPNPLVAENASLQREVTALTAQVASLTSSLNVAQAAETSLKAQVATLTAQLAAATKPAVADPPSVATATPTTQGGGGAFDAWLLGCCALIVALKAGGGIRNYE
jgi:cell division protein FtsB